MLIRFSSSLADTWAIPNSQLNRHFTARAERSTCKEYHCAMKNFEILSMKDVLECLCLLVSTHCIGPRNLHRYRIESYDLD